MTSPGTCRKLLPIYGSQTTHVFSPLRSRRNSPGPVRATFCGDLRTARARATAASRAGACARAGQGPGTGTCATRAPAASGRETRPRGVRGRWRPKSAMNCSIGRPPRSRGSTRRRPGGPDPRSLRARRETRAARRPIRSLDISSSSLSRSTCGEIHTPSAERAEPRPGQLRPEAVSEVPTMLGDAEGHQQPAPLPLPRLAEAVDARWRRCAASPRSTR